MSKTKTKPTSVNVFDFINSFVENEQKKQDSFHLIELMEKWSGYKAYMWGPSIIGFGSYHYKYASGHEGDAPMLGFSPRKAAFSLYVFTPIEKNMHLLENFGNFKISKACIYIKKLSDIDLNILKEMCKASMEYLREHHECGCREK
ncbi:MAG: DUF1801 domain-containing protein [Bacteroidota bacterium]